ncbi:MAG: DUF1361 domain-containing protein [Bacteroidota bacterium]
MLKLLKQNNRLHETLFMGTLSILCFSLSIFRFIYADNKIFLFLNWNLFLAFLPWAFSTLIIIRPKMSENKLIVILLMCLWLLFFPNAPYILTDLFHLRLKTSMPVWFDLVLILSFAWTGLLFGFLSLWDIENVLEKWIRKKIIPVISILLLFIGSFGIYLGRYLRWNSWDIIKEPFGLFYDITDRMVNPANHPRTWGMTVFMAMFLIVMYFSFRILRRRTETHSSK